MRSPPMWKSSSTPSNAGSHASTKGAKRDERRGVRRLLIAADPALSKLSSYPGRSCRAWEPSHLLREHSAVEFCPGQLPPGAPYSTTEVGLSEVVDKSSGSAWRENVKIIAQALILAM